MAVHCSLIAIKKKFIISLLLFPLSLSFPTFSFFFLSLVCSCLNVSYLQLFSFLFFLSSLLLRLSFTLSFFLSSPFIPSLFSFSFFTSCFFLSLLFHIFSISPSLWGWWILVVMMVVIDFGYGCEFCEFSHGFGGGD